MVFGLDPVSAEVDRVLAALERGAVVADEVETRYVDLKEEPAAIQLVIEQMEAMAPGLGP